MGPIFVKTEKWFKLTFSLIDKPVFVFYYETILLPMFSQGLYCIIFYLKHEENCVEDNQGHDEILEGSWLNNSPQLVFITLPFLKENWR